MLRLEALGQRDPVAVVGHAAMISAGKVVYGFGEIELAPLERASMMLSHEVFP